LRINKGIKEFVLWGRSMGAVAALLYAIELA
jgi:pimeloyl-ACP methyl ester carboxylesterase